MRWLSHLFESPQRWLTAVRCERQRLHLDARGHHAMSPYFVFPQWPVTPSAPTTPHVTSLAASAPSPFACWRSY